MVRRKGGNKTIDLHGRTADEAIDYFISQSNNFLASGQRGHIVVIHGYGSSGHGDGVIKRRLRELVTRWTDYFEAVHCDDSMPGETWVVPLKQFPLRRGAVRSLEQQICAFCETRKTERQVFQRFHQRPEHEVWKLLYELQRKELLEPVMKKGQKAWRVPAGAAARGGDRGAGLHRVAGGFDSDRAFGP